MYQNSDKKTYHNKLVLIKHTVLHRVGVISGKMHLITFEIGRFHQNQFYFKETLKYTNQQFFLFTNIMRKLY